MTENKQLDKLLSEIPGLQQSFESYKSNAVQDFEIQNNYYVDLLSKKKVKKLSVKGWHETHPYLFAIICASLGVFLDKVLPEIFQWVLQLIRLRLS